MCSAPASAVSHEGPPSTPASAVSPGKPPSAPRVLIVITPEYERFSHELGLPHRFLFDLLKEDDWSLVIKLHALVETR